MRWLTPKADYEADLARSIQLYSQQLDEKLKLQEITPDASDPKIFDAFIASDFDAFIASECLKHFEDDAELQPSRIDKNTFRMSPLLEKPLYVENQNAN